MGNMLRHGRTKYILCFALDAARMTISATNFIENQTLKKTNLLHTGEVRKELENIMIRKKLIYLIIK